MSFIGPVLLYGSYTWVLTKREQNKLHVFERKVLRTICGPKLENGVYRKRYNFKSSTARYHQRCKDEEIALRWSDDQKNFSDKPRSGY
jgi:hypothetical protein